MLKQELACLPTGNVGLDIDGTITANPRLFRDIALEVQERGDRIHVISTRSRIGRPETIAELSDLGILYDFLFLTPSPDAPDYVAPPRPMNGYDAMLWQKVAYAQRNGLRAMFDDDEQVIELFRRHAREIIVNPLVW